MTRSVLVNVLHDVCVYYIDLVVLLDSGNGDETWIASVAHLFALYLDVYIIFRLRNRVQAG